MPIQKLPAQDDELPPRNKTLTFISVVLLIVFVIAIAVMVNNSNDAYRRDVQNAESYLETQIHNNELTLAP